MGVDLVWGWVWYGMGVWGYGTGMVREVPAAIADVPVALSAALPHTAPRGTIDRGCYWYVSYGSWPGTSGSCSGGSASGSGTAGGIPGMPSSGV